VTITIDQYGSPRGALWAYRQAVQKSRSIRGFKSRSVANLGQQTFAGSVTIDAETNIGLGLLDHRLTVGATLAGYDAPPDNIAKLVAPVRIQAESQEGNKISFHGLKREQDRAGRSR
jgi:hypothetical protein